jgi:hypothetical protein
MVPAARQAANPETSFYRQALQNSPKGASMGNLKEQNPHSERNEEGVDKAIEDSFPASDPPSTGGVTRIETDETKDDKKKN